MGRRIKCPVGRCGRLLAPEMMEQHLRLVHGAGEGAHPPDVCLMCLAVIPVVKSSNPHSECGMNDSVVCPVAGCRKVCGSPEAVQKHVHADHADVRKRLRAEYQDTVAKALEKARAFNAPPPVPPPGPSPVPSPVSADRIPCPDCTTTFRDAASLRRHARIYHNPYRATLGCPTCLQCRAPTQRQLMKVMAKRGCTGNRNCPHCPAGTEIRPASVLGRRRRGGLSLLVQHLVAEHGYTRAKGTSDYLDRSPGNL